MSRVGKMPVTIPAGVTVDVTDANYITVKGPLGELKRQLPTVVDIKVEGSEIIVTRANDTKRLKEMHGLTRSLINNMVVGVSQGFEKKLEVNGVGYRVQKQGKKLVLNLGYSHPVEMEDPEGVETIVEDQNKITVKGIEKDKVGQLAAQIRAKRPPEPYKARASNTRMNISEEKSARPVSNQRRVRK